MSSNYPEGSMKGSGIDVDEVAVTRYCVDCEQDFETIAYTNDWHTEMAYECPTCQAQFVESLSKEPDYDEMLQAHEEELLDD